MAIFHYSFTDLENYPIVTPFEPDDFFSESRPRINLTLGGKNKERYSVRTISDQMHDAGRQMWEIRVPKDVEFTL